MGIKIEQVKLREKKLMASINKLHIDPTGKQKPRLSNKHKQHIFVQSKLKDSCTKCNRSFEKVKRKIVYSRKRGIRRKNYCILCHKNMVIQTNKIRRKRWDNFKKLWIQHRGNKCYLCTYNDLSCISVFDFHHKNNEVKEFSISTLSQFGYNITNKKLFVNEARKCFVVCANCHRKIERTGVLLG